MIYEPETVKGFQDILPPESQKRTAVRAVIEKKFQNYGFVPIETPTIEYEELMRTNSLESEDDAISDRFRLKDRGGRNLSIRYEFTFQLAKLIKLNPNLKMPFKRYQIGSVFRDEPTGTERFREFTQCDVDVIGDLSIESDAEILAITTDLLKELNINFNVEVNNRKLLNAIINSLQIENGIAVIRELDKIDKIGEDTVKINLRKYADANQIISLFKLMQKDLNFFKDNLFEGADEIFKLEEFGKAYGFKIKFNPWLARGLSYYTGNIFEVKNEKQTIAGGGRYDKSVGRFMNREIPAVGISFGLDRISAKAKIEIIKTKVALISINQDKETIKFAQKLRMQNISCVTNFEKIGKALEYADSYGIPYAIFIGKDEISKKKYKLRDMKSGEESLLTEKSLISKLIKI
ncbi:histidine--tRNA ligase [Candidatus Pacearchaeota archaeon]|nr:histidine--tRNA ligase [Candidatus Pacearchaeota archaeon]